MYIFLKETTDAIKQHGQSQCVIWYTYGFKIDGGIGVGIHEDRPRYDEFTSLCYCISSRNLGYKCLCIGEFEEELVIVK